MTSRHNYFSASSPSRRRISFRPAVNAEQALRRCLWPIGAFLVFTQLLHPWYVLWLVPLVALFLRPGRRGLAFGAWTGWFLFAGTVVMSYTYYIALKIVIWTLLVEFVPFYVPLTVPPLVRSKPV